MISFKYAFLSVLIIILLGMGFQRTSAQQVKNNKIAGKISGRIFDNLTNQPLQFASFVVISSKDSTKIYGANSDSSGRFLIDNIPLGVYRAKVSLIGYKTRSRQNIILNPAFNNIKIDTIMLTPTGITTNEVKVIAQKERIVYDKENSNRITINPDKDWGNNALDLLENTPMVHIDMDETSISLMGQEGTVIYIDGVPGKFSGIESLQDLKLLPSLSIDKFELYFNGSVEFGENSTGGVINIITKKSISTNYSGNTEFTINNDNKYEGILGGSYSNKLYKIGGQYYSTHSYHGTSTQTSRQIILNDTVNSLEQLNESINSSISNLYKAFFDLNPAPNQSISLHPMYRDIYNIVNNNLLNKYSSLSLQDLNNTKKLQKFFSVGLNYQLSFDKPGHYLRTYLLFMNNHQDVEAINNQSEIYYLRNVKDINILQKQNSNNSDKSYSWAVSYTNPVSSIINLSANIGGDYKQLLMSSQYYLFDSLKNNFYEQNNLTINQNYDDYVHKIAPGINGIFAGVQYGMGLQVNIKNSSATNYISESNYHNNFISYDPSLRISFDICERNNLSISYFRSTGFPLNKQLNPYVDYSDSTHITGGNPGLKPEENKSYSINYSHNEMDLSLIIIARYSNGTDIIDQVTTPVNDRVIMTTYKNIASQKSWGLNFDLNNYFYKWLVVESVLAAKKLEYVSPGIYNQGSNWSARMLPSLSFDILKFQFDINYLSPSVTAQGKTKSTFYVNAAAKLLMFNKALSISLRISDIFNTRNNNNDQYGTGFIISNKINQVTRIVSLNLAYYFQGTADKNIDEKNEEELKVKDDF